MSVYSSPDQLRKIQKILRGFLRLPVATDSIPGAFLEAVLAHVRDSERLATYDYIDVLDRKNRVGWSIKSTKQATPLTWKRAKIANKTNLISASLKSDAGLQQIGDAIIAFCNDHARDSIEKYGLEQIGYARLVLSPSGEINYFEKLLCTRDRPDIFVAEEFTWRWSTEKVGGTKEQLSALHGLHVPSGKRWWAWHGRGENQLHFTGERAWWPPKGTPHTLTFDFPNASDKVSLERLTELLESL